MASKFNMHILQNELVSTLLIWLPCMAWWWYEPVSILPNVSGGNESGGYSTCWHLLHQDGMVDLGTKACWNTMTTGNKRGTHLPCDMWKAWHYHWNDGRNYQLVGKRIFGYSCSRHFRAFMSLGVVQLVWLDLQCDAHFGTMCF
jgi:hypothetical protein